MRMPIIALFLLTIVPVALSAEDGAGSHGYVFVAPGRVDESTTLHLGAGGEGRIYKGFGAGAEVGFVGYTRQFRGGFGIFSANGLYDFQVPPSSKLIPFATAGYSLGVRSGTINGFNFGFGANYWVADGKGIRLEFRQHRFVGRAFDEFRIGLSLR